MDIKELIGVTLGTCTIEQVIGRGGMGAVFLAQQSRPMRTVAVKVLIPSSNYDEEEQRVFLERFRREADTIAKLEHKNILPVYEYDEDVVDSQRLAYLVMPYIRGGTLRERMDEMKREGRQFDLKTIVSYISQVADALSYAHSFGVVHRDIKPGNLLFHQDGRLLLSDFGIVRLRALPSLTSVGSFLGTAEYASPEQISGGTVDYRSDIYSLGIILYELLTGSVPFTGVNPFAVMSKKLNDPVPSMQNVRPDLSPAVEAVVKKALEKNPADRYASATEMAAALQRAINTSTSAAALRLSGDGNNDDLTLAERPPLPRQAAAASPLAGTVAAIPQTVPAGPNAPAAVPPGGAAPWQQPPRPWQWPSQGQAQAQTGGPQVATRTSAPKVNTTGQTYRQGRRLYYYSVSLIALLLQLLVVFFLLNTRTPVGSSSADILGVLLGSSINLLILAVIEFTGVTRRRNTRRFLYRCLVVALLAPLVSGLFINFGSSAKGLHLPLVAYIVLLLSNLYAVRQLAKVDAKEQVEVAPVLWRSALVGALTGMLPLTIILIFALGLPALPALHVANSSPLLRLFFALFIIFIGAPTPGSMLAVYLSQKMSYAVLLRSSALAAMFMFLGAFVLVILWEMLPSNHVLFAYSFSQPMLALGIGGVLLVLMGVLRGMVDAWVYRKVRGRSMVSP